MATTTKVGKVKSFIRESISPRISHLSGRILLGNGLDRSSLISTLNAQNLSAIQQGHILRVLEGERVIKTRFRGQAATFAELGDYMLSASLTPEKIETTLRSVLDATAINLAPHIAATRASGMRRAVDAVTNSVWSIRDSLNKSEAQTLRMQELSALMVELTKQATGTQMIEQNTIAEVVESTTRFLESSGTILTAMRTDHSALLKEVQRKGMLARDRHVSAREKALYTEISDFLSNLGNPTTNQHDSLLNILSGFERIPELKGKSGKHIREITADLREVIEHSRSGDQDKAQHALEKSLLSVNDMLKHPETKNWPLRILSLSAVIFSAVYIVYRLWTLTTPGYILPSYLAALALISAEAFCNWSSIINNLGVAKALFKTEGANGQSWLGKKRSQLDRDPFRRPRAALFLSSFNEPVKPLLDSTKAAIRSVWAYGAASLKLLDDSKMHYNYFGIKNSVRNVKKMSAVKETIAQIATHQGVADPVVAHEISCSMAARETELDDLETRRFAILRATQDTARNYNVYEKRAMRLGERIWEEYNRSGHATEAYVLKAALELKIERSRAIKIAEEIAGKIESLNRKSRIAELTGKLLDGKALQLTEKSELEDLLVAEHRISSAQARGIVATIENQHQAIYEVARATVGEVELFDTPQHRQIYYQALLYMEGLMAVNEKGNSIETDMPTKYRQIIEYALGMKHRRAFYTRLGEEIANGISNLTKMSNVIENIFVNNPGITFEEANARAWESRADEVRALIRAVGQHYGLSEREIEVITEGSVENLGQKTEVRKPGILQNLEENREERTAAALELVQYLGDFIASGMSAADAVAQFDREKGIPGQPNNSRPAIQQIADAIFNTGVQRVTSPITLGALTLNLNLITERTNEYAEFVHRDKRFRNYVEKSGKAGAINNSIHGLTTTEQVAEMLRQIVHHRVNESVFGERHIPEEIITDIDRHVVDQIPLNYDVAEARPEKVAHHLLTLLVAGNTPLDASRQLVDRYSFPLECAERMQKELHRIAREMLSRIVLHEYLAQKNQNPNAQAGAVLAGITQFGALTWSDKRKVRKMIKGIEDGKISNEQVYHWIIPPTERTAAHVAEYMIAVRRLPEITLKSGENFNSELRNFAPQIDAVLTANAPAIQALRTAGRSAEEIAEQVIGLATPAITYTSAARDRYGNAVTSPFEQFRPQMSGLKYKVIGCFDADYRINTGALEEIMPYFLDHSSYFFLGKRQFGRNYPWSNTARVMQNAQDGFWGFQNIASSLYNNTASWGSCVFHTTKSYVESSRWIDQMDYYGTFFRSPYFDFRLEPNAGLQNFIGNNAPRGKYKYVPRLEKLIINGAMTPAERDALRTLYTGNNAALHTIDKAYRSSQKWRRHTAKITDTPALQAFLADPAKNPIGKYRYQNGRLIINGKMTPADKNELFNIVTSDREKRRIEIMELNSNHNWYFIWNNTNKKWSEQKKFTPLRVINSLQVYTEKRFGFKPNSLFTRTLFALSKVTSLPVHILYVMFGARLRNALHERGLRGKSFGWERKFDANSIFTIDMLASQDHRTESEDIASCMWDLRKMPYVTGNGQPLARSGFVEGTGGLGSHAEDFRAYEATDLTRWRRGNLALLPEIENTSMGFMAKRRYLLLAKYWLLGTLRMAFIASPVVFAFMGLDPIITTSLAFLGGMAFTNFGVNMGAYMMGMGARGHRLLSSLRAMLIDYYMTLTKAKSVVDGYYIMESTAFVTSPKKQVVPLKQPNWKLKMEHLFAGANLLAAAYATWFGIQTLEPGIAANIPKFFVPFWSLFTASLIEGSIFYMNRGVNEKNAGENLTNPLLKRKSRLNAAPAQMSEEGN